MNKYSRRYDCPSCGCSGRASRDKVETGIITCAYCRKELKASPLFRGNKEEESRFIEQQIRKVLPV